MIYIVAIIGIALCLLCIVGMAAPALITDRVLALAGTRVLRIVAVGIRLVVGSLLMLAAPDTAFPYTLFILGAFVFLAGIVLVFIGDALLNAMIQWAIALPETVLRVGFAAGSMMGAFLLYAAIA